MESLLTPMGSLWHPYRPSRVPLWHPYRPSWDHNVLPNDPQVIPTGDLKPTCDPDGIPTDLHGILMDTPKTLM
eukprot:9426625-Pyramimonas_sp.AAC.1